MSLNLVYMSIKGKNKNMIANILTLLISISTRFYSYIKIKGHKLFNLQDEWYLLLLVHTANIEGGITEFLNLVLANPES